MVTGSQINYYFICHRKLWLFSHGLHCEQDSDLVRMGKLIHETSYKRENKEIDIDGTIVLDWYDAKNKLVHEVKKSDKMEEAHEWQICYYLYYLSTKGLEIARSVGEEGIKGELNYPTLRTKKAVILTVEKENVLVNTIIPEIKRIIALEEMPSTQEWKVCKSCSYNELCYS